MKLNKLAIAIALTSAAFGANAATYNLHTLAAGDNYLSGSETALISVGVGHFTDVFNFTLSSLSSLDGNANTFNVGIKKLFSIQDATFSYSLIDSSNTVWASGNNASGFSLLSLAAGNYHLDVTGDTTVGAKVVGGTYNGTLTVAAIPEPESYAMLLAGLGLMGTIARRRSKSEKG